MAESTPRVEFLWWEECPSWERALSILHEEMEELGLDPASVVVRELLSDIEAREADFVGSPTIRVDGQDIQPPGDEPVGLTCRVYRRPDGRTSPLPDRADVRDALVSAIEGDSHVDE
jgi:hypothetical protein